MEKIYQRLGDLRNYALCAFNRNARTNLESKLPRECTDVSTINSWCGRVQGYKYRDYDAKKLRWIFRDLTEDMPQGENKPDYTLGYIIADLIERMRDLCLFKTSPDDVDWWREAIEATVSRYGSLEKKYLANPQQILQWLPVVSNLAFLNRKKIDLSEQICRPVMDAIDRTGWKMRFECTVRGHVWTDDDVSHFADLIKSIHVAPAKGLLIDEGQDLCLSQIAVLIAQVWRDGELTIVGDDRSGIPGSESFQAGQAIFGWRGAFGGSLVLIRRLWKELTGEEGETSPLSVTHRMRPEIVDAVKGLNTELSTSRSEGGAAFKTSYQQAFEAWIDLEQGELPAQATALWLSRTNKVIAQMFVKTLRKRASVTLRGGADIEKRCQGLLKFIAGSPKRDGEYKVTLEVAIMKLRELIEQDEIDEDDPNSFEGLLMELMVAVQEDPSVLEAAGLPPVATVGNVKKLLLHYTDKDSPRVLSTVYRAKGDEADLVIVDDVEKFNESWHGDDHERDAVAHVACTRAKELMLTVGNVSGVRTEALEPGERVFDHFEFKAGH
jgi:superfamily I DNA/RNA helicase